MNRPARTELAQANVAAAAGHENASPWSPLRSPVFRALWIASVVSNLGTWMQNIGAAWLMTTLTTSPLMIALVQAATSLPVFLVALPAGALADVVDRRRLLLITQFWMLLAAALLGVLTIFEAVNTWTLLGFTAALGLGAAMNAPAWQAIVPELVAPGELQAAVALNSAGFNVARAVGPALAGVIVAVSGPGPVFLLNAVSFVAVLWVLYRWRRERRVSRLPAEHVIGAIRAGIRYARHAPALQVVLIRSGVFIFCGAALWALLPLVARQQLGLGAVGYGVLLGCLGTGAVLGAALLPQIKGKVSLDTLAAGAVSLFAAATIILAFVDDAYLVGATMLAAGVAWIVLMSSFNAAAQKAAPEWVRARGLALYLLVFQGGTAAGSIVWGTVAAHWGIPASLSMAAMGLIAGLAAAKRYRLAQGEKLDLTPSLHWPEPHLQVQPQSDQGPVLVTIEYLVEPARSDAFTKAMRQVRQQRLRDGAMQWGLFNDPANPARYVETFLVESWAEHMRQHERVTVADHGAEEVSRGFHIGDRAPVVTHFISAGE
jgi:MFS family permease